MKRATKITVRMERVRGVKFWRVRFKDPVSLRLRRKYFPTEKAAAAFADKLQNRNRDTEGTWALLSVDEKNNLIAAQSQAEKFGLDVLQAVMAQAQAGAAKVEVRLVKVIGELLSVKRTGGRDPGYVNNLEYVLTWFAEGKDLWPIERVGLVDLEKFLEQAKIEYRSTLRARLSTLFNFAVRRGYLAANPCARLEPVKVVRLPRRIFSLAEMKTALKWLHKECPRLQPWFVLTTFCGLRPEEAMQTRAEDVNFQEGFIRVEAQTTKIRQRGIVYPRPEAMRILKTAAGVDGTKIKPFTRAAKKKLLQRFADALDWPVWHKDVTRHTAASYWLAIEPDVAKVSAMLRNSPKVLLRDYKALVTKADAKKFWAMT